MEHQLPRRAVRGYDVSFPVFVFVGICLFVCSWFWIDGLFVIRGFGWILEGRTPPYAGAYFATDDTRVPLDAAAAAFFLCVGTRREWVLPLPP